MKLKLIATGILLTFPLWTFAKDVTIIYTNDLHAHVDTYKLPYVANGKRAIGGFANITTLVKQEKLKNKATFYFDAGDYFTGPYISSLTKGKAIIDIMNTMPFDAVSIGNHDLRFTSALAGSVLNELCRAGPVTRLIFRDDGNFPVIGGLAGQTLGT